MNSYDSSKEYFGFLQDFKKENVFLDKIEKNINYKGGENYFDKIQVKISNT